MRMTADNVQAVLGVRPERLPEILPDVFAKLLEPNQDETFLQNYCGALKRAFDQDERPDGQLGFDSLGEACVEAGITKTMLKITQCTRPEMGCAIAAYQALDSLRHLMRTANVSQRRVFVKELLENDALEICLYKATSHPLCIHRHLGVSVLRCLAAEAFLGDEITAIQTADVITKMCQFILAGPDFFVEQMQSPSTTWQSRMQMGSLGIPPSVSSRYVLRYYAMGQESAIWAAHGLLCRSPPPKKQFCLEIIQHNPDVLNLLFDCAIVARPAWYPETQVDSIACEVLALLFHFPLDVVPGVSGPPEDMFKEESDVEWNAMCQLLKILTSLPNWTEKITAVWTKIDDEKWQKVKPLFNRVKNDYLAQEPPDEQSFRQIFEYRGTSRICMLRLITTITHAVKVCDISEADLITLLRLGYMGSQKVKNFDDLEHSRDVSDHYTWIERAQEIYRSPMFTVFTLDKVDPPEQIANEPVIGSTAFVRLLFVLAERGILAKIQKWKKLPPGMSSSVTLRQVQQATSPEVLKQVLAMTLKRVTERRETGHKRLRETDPEYARVAYSTAAELAAALVAFDRASGRKWKGVIGGAQRETVLCLGNAAEMALRLKQYRRAYKFALSAVTAAQDADVLDEALLEKNKRRVVLAKSGLGI